MIKASLRKGSFFPFHFKLNSKYILVNIEKFFPDVKKTFNVTTRGLIKGFLLLLR